MITHFTRPHESVYQDKVGKQFVLQENNPIYQTLSKQEYNPDQGDESKTMQDILQLSFDLLTVEEIRQRYGEIEVLKNLSEVVE